MKHYEISDYYLKFIETFTNVDSEIFDLETKEISRAIYKHIFKIRCGLWKQSVLFKRRKRISISDLFQDIIALYLKLSLNSSKFEIVLEEKSGKLQPDILIKHNGNNHFILEIKTTIGWNRNSLNGAIQNRINQLSNEFQIPLDNVVYIFLSPWNVNKKFAEKYWDITENQPNPLPKEFPFNKIRPLMTADDPYYWNHEKGFDRSKSFKDYSDNEIENFSKNSIVVPIEVTIKEIIKAANST